MPLNSVYSRPSEPVTSSIHGIETALASSTEISATDRTLSPAPSAPRDVRPPVASSTGDLGSRPDSVSLRSETATPRPSSRDADRAEELLPPLEAALLNLERVRASIRGGHESGSGRSTPSSSERRASSDISVTPSRAGWRQPSSRGPAPLLTTTRPVSLYLTQLGLSESFDFKWPFFGDDINELRVLGVAWDLSGRPPYVFAPDRGSGPYFRVRPSEHVAFLGDGLQIWPSSTVTGGLNVRILVVESDAPEREAGRDLSEAKQAVDESGLTPALEKVGAGASPANIAALEAASQALDAALSTLSGNADDQVALFDGTFGAESLDRRPPDSEETYSSPGASIKLRLVVGEPSSSAASSPSTSPSTSISALSSPSSTPFSAPSIATAPSSPLTP